MALISYFSCERQTGMKRQVTNIASILLTEFLVEFLFEFFLRKIRQNFRLWKGSSSKLVTLRNPIYTAYVIIQKFYYGKILVLLIQ